MSNNNSHHFGPHKEPAYSISTIHTGTENHTAHQNLCCLANSCWFMKANQNSLRGAETAIYWSWTLCSTDWRSAFDLERNRHADPMACDSPSSDSQNNRPNTCAPLSPWNALQSSLLLSFFLLPVHLTVCIVRSSRRESRQKHIYLIDIKLCRFFYLKHSWVIFFSGQNI